MTVTTVNEDTAKLLAKLGYPQIDEGEKPSSLLPRCMACVTKRLKKMAEMMPSADPNADGQAAGQAPGQAGDGKDAKGANADAKNIWQRRPGLTIYCTSMFNNCMSVYCRTMNHVTSCPG